MRPTEKKIQNLVQNLSDQTRPELDAKILDNCFTELNTRKSIPASRNTWTIIMKKSITKIAAAIIIIALLTGIYQLTGSIDGASIVWADVVKQFNSITFFTASVYMKENATDEPVQIEIWRNSQKKARIRVDSQVLFGDGSAVVAGDKPAHHGRTAAHRDRPAQFQLRTGRGR